MKSLLIYAAGFVTPFIIAFACMAVAFVTDWRASRRYQRAWDFFSKRFDALTPEQLDWHRAYWKEHSYRFEQIASDRERYFSMNWQWGQTKEV